MINFSAFESVHQRYKKDEMYFLSELKEVANRDKRYQGLRILHNIPLTIEAALKIEVLLLGGANVTASCISILPPHQEAIDVLKAAHVDLRIEHVFSGDYDFHLDCCGELIDIAPPKMGAVELTQTGSELYKKSSLHYPVLSVDDSDLKLLETFFGTGEGFIRALSFRTNAEIYDKKFIIFGYGKVDKGIVHSLLKFTDNIVIIDINQNSMKSAPKRGLKYIDSRERERIKRELKNASFVVTATGVKGLISDFYNFKKSHFNDAILANMGAYDEYGRNFSIKDVLFEKKPLNFSIQEPTTMKYLDPIFYAHNYAIDLILSGKIHPGYNAFPQELARGILEKWAIVHQEALFEIEEYFF